MTNLTNEFRRQLTRRIVAHRFKKATAAAAQAVSVAADALYEALYSKAVKAWIAKAPKGFLSQSPSLCIDLGKRRIYVSFSESRAVAEEHLHAGFSAKDYPGLATEIGNATTAYEALLQCRIEENDAARDVMAQLRQYRTLKQLREGWPEIESLLPPVEPPGRALIVPPTKLNALLNLPPK
jgi:hypothetical protein